MKWFRLLAAALVVIVLAAIATAQVLSWYLQRPLPLPRVPYDFNVPAGATLSSVSRSLAGEGVLDHPQILSALARWRGVDRSIKAGSYEIGEGATLESLLAKLTQGDVMQSALTVVEGTTFADFRKQLRDHPAVGKVWAGLPDADVAKRLGIDAANPEGWFFPDTYFFPTGSSDELILTRAHRLLRERLQAAWDKRDPALPLASPYEALILASIVEKETGRASERPAIASVFVNRLRQSMRLQTDPTVIYGMGAAFDGNIRKRDLETDTAYNTYTRDGLPPTPIALVSQASLDAVMRPPTTQYLYFVARGDGTSEFSTNLADHNRAVARYQLRKAR